MFRLVVLVVMEVPTMRTPREAVPCDQIMVHGGAAGYAFKVVRTVGRVSMHQLLWALLARMPLSLWILRA